MPEIMQKIIVDRRAIQDRLERGRSTASVIISHMRALGVDVRLFGSMKKGQIDIASDIDLLVVDCGTLDHDDIGDHILSVASDNRRRSAAAPWRYPFARPRQGRQDTVRPLAPCHSRAY